MRIAFAAATLPDIGTWVVLAGSDGTLGPAGAELDRRAGGALRRALGEGSGNFKRGETIDLRYPAGLELDRRHRVEPGQARGSIAPRSGNARRQPGRKAQRVAGCRGQRGGGGDRRSESERAGVGDQPGDRRLSAQLPLRQVPYDQGGGRRVQRRDCTAHVAPGRPGQGGSGLACGGRGDRRGRPRARSGHGARQRAVAGGVR